MNPLQSSEALLPQVAGHAAEQSSSRTIDLDIDGDWETEGYRNLSFGQVAKAVDAMAFWLDENLDVDKQFEPFAYYGSKDFQYAVVVLAAIKTGRKAS